MTKEFKLAKLGCYGTSMSLSVVTNLSPVLFLTFRSLYGISYSLLGLLVLVNFVTQLTVDLIFSFFSHKINMKKAVKVAPLLTLLGLFIFALWPLVSPETAYTGLLVGTIIFSASGGFVEVLITPVVAAIHPESAEQEVSKVHSVYAWGAMAVVITTTLYLKLFGNSNWYFLALLFLLFPLFSFLTFLGAEIPEMERPKKLSGITEYLRNGHFWLFFCAIFLGGSAECTMAQWISGYLERAVNVPKLWGDVFGTALFALMLGLGRSLYGKYGKNIYSVILWGAIGASLCYVVAAFSPVPVLGVAACAFTGFCTSMLWPGCLLAATERFPRGGVFVYAMMATGGDLGASVGPQSLGVVTDIVLSTDGGRISAWLPGGSPERIGMHLGILVTAIFPVVLIFLLAKIKKMAQR